MPLDQQGFVIADPETKADPFTLDSLIAWLRTQNPWRTYEYSKPGTCVWGAYVDAAGGEFIGKDYVIGNFLMSACFPTDSWTWERTVAQGQWPDNDQTFGAALDRAIALKATQDAKP